MLVWPFTLVLVLIIGIASCFIWGDILARQLKPKSSKFPATLPAAGYPKTLKPPGAREIIIPTKPTRIVATNCGAADILSELADVENIAAVPFQVEQYSASAEFWREHPETPRFDKFQAETVLAFKPDLIVASAVQDGGTTAALERMKVPILPMKDYESLDDIRASILLVGQAIGEEERAREKVKAFDARLNGVEKRVKTDEKVTALIYSNFGTGYTFGSASVQHDMLVTAGAENAAAAAGFKGLAPISFEQVLRINPMWLVVCGENGFDSPQVRLVLNEPALSGLQAVKNRRIAVIPTRNFDATSQYIVDAVEILANQIHPISSRPQAIPLH